MFNQNIVDITVEYPRLDQEYTFYDIKESVVGYFEAIENGNIPYVIAYCLLKGYDPNYRIRMNNEHRTDADRFPLKIALQNYNIELANALILMGARIHDIHINFDNKDTNSVMAAALQKTIEFCKDHNISYEVVDYGEES